MAVNEHGDYVLTREITEEEFRAAVDPLAENGIPVQGWTIQTIRNMKMSIKTFLKSIRVLTSVKNADQRDNIIGAMNSFFSVPGQCTPALLLRGCDFVKKKEGQQVLRQMQLQSKLKKKAAGRHTVEMTGLISIFELQRTTMAAAIKEVRTKGERRILELRRQLDFEEQQLDREVATTREQFFPVCVFEELSHAEVKQRALDMLLNEAQRVGAATPEVTNALLTEAVSRYGHRIKQDHAAAFLQKQAHIEGLRSFLSEQILQSERVGDVKQREHLRNSMHVIFGDGTGGPAGGGEEVAGGGSADRRVNAGGVGGVDATLKEGGGAEPQEVRGRGRGQGLRPRSQFEADNSRRVTRARTRGDPSCNL